VTLKSFYDSVEMPTKIGMTTRCLLTNTYNEFANNEDQLIQYQAEFMDNLKAVFVQN
jgi:hypothetical protein